MAVGGLTSLGESYGFDVLDPLTRGVISAFFAPSAPVGLNAWERIEAEVTDAKQTDRASSESGWYLLWDWP